MGEVRYWFAGNAWLLCLAESDAFVTAAYWADEGHLLGVTMMPRRFWDHYHALACR